MSYSEDSSDPEWKNGKAKTSKAVKLEMSSSQGRPKYLQKFCDKWLNVFHPWLQRSEDDLNKPFCRACQTTLDCNRCHLQRHERTSKHARNLEILLNKGEGAARQNLSIRRERSKYYQQRKKLNASLTSFEASDVGVDVTDDIIEEYQPDSKAHLKSDIDDNTFQFVQTDMAATDQYSEETSIKQSPTSTVKTGYRSFNKVSDQVRGVKKGIKKERMKLLMQIQKDKNDLMDSFKELVCGNNTFQAPPQKERNHVDLFFDSVSSSIKALSPKLIAESKMRISQLVCELELRALTENDASAHSGHTLVVSPQVGPSYIINEVTTVDPENHDDDGTQQYEHLT